MKLNKGDRVRLKTRTIFGWKGTGTVMEDQLSQLSNSPDAVIKFRPDDAKPDDEWAHCLACRFEVARIRRPNDQAHPLP